MAKWIVKFLKKVALKLALVLIPLYLIFSTQALVNYKEPLTPEATKVARDTVKNVWEQLSSSSDSIEFSLKQHELNQVSALAGHTLKKLNTVFNISPVGMTAAFSYEVSTPLYPVYFNGYCTLIPGFDGFEFDSCQLGKVPVPNFISNYLIKTLISLIFGQDASETFSSILSNVKIKGDTVVIVASKSESLKDSIKASLKDASSMVRSVSRDKNIDPNNVSIYIRHLHSLPRTETSSIAQYIGEAFYLAQKRSVDSDPVMENQSALWALVVVFGNTQFSELAGINIPKSNNIPRLTIRGREDLNLHFLYSIVLEQMGDVNIGLSIGEIKELLDTNKGGSGYSFADLAADKAGLKFAEFVTENDEHAVQAQDRLSRLRKSGDESIFFPFIHDLPEGFNQKQFREIIGNTESTSYKSLESKIDTRINNLLLYSDYNTNSGQVQALHVAPTQLSIEAGQWLKVDTHIHSKFSDGRHSISTIAEKARFYGCDAIAITDHGDFKLEEVTSENYVNTINQINSRYENLTVMAGMEWNLPPFMGREHATLLLPDSPDLQAKLSEFRDKFDSWGRRSSNLLDTSLALNWLEQYGKHEMTKPVIFYNHPSRKDFQVKENYHDMESWLTQTNYLVGMSGAPGHQKQDFSKIGSYFHRIKTIDRWDPTVAISGGVWDQLLQKGYRVLAARADSDFHNETMDYWPCQFSTTHLYAKSNSHNDILNAYHSGKFWAQHGQIVDSLSFSAHVGNDNISMGQQFENEYKLPVDVELFIMPAYTDWRGKGVKIDEIELIIIDGENISSINIPSSQYEDQVLIHIKETLEMTTDRLIIRARGRSKQKSAPDYMFYTNPIFISSKS